VTANFSTSLTDPKIFSRRASLEHRHAAYFFPQKFENSLGRISELIQRLRRSAASHSNDIEILTLLWNQFFQRGYVAEERHMPGDPKDYREHAKRCLKIAQETTNPALRASLEEIAHHWLRLAADFEATKPLLEAWGDPCFFGKLTSGGVDPASSRRLSENDEADTELIASVGARAFQSSRRGGANSLKSTVAILENSKPRKDCRGPP
jgi:hypothetical protein